MLIFFLYSILFLQNLNWKEVRYNFSSTCLEILELPYADETMSMLIVLPSSPTVQISSKLQGFNFSAIRGEPLRDAKVSIPKFNMKYQTYLKKKLTDLGVTDLFTSASNLKGKNRDLSHL